MGDAESRLDHKKDAFRFRSAQAQLEGLHRELGKGKKKAKKRQKKGA